MGEARNLAPKLPSELAEEAEGNERGQTPRHLMVHIDGAIKLANPLVSGQADPYTE